MKLPASISLDTIAAESEGYTGADLAGLCHLAARLCKNDNPHANQITEKYFVEAFKQYKPVGRKARGAAPRW